MHTFDGSKSGLLYSALSNEYESVIDHALSLGISDCYVQEGATASEKFVPDFIGDGVLFDKKLK